MKKITHQEESNLSTDLISNLRKLREEICFPVVNRGPLWYNSLTDEQRIELREWYFAWLNVTETKDIPNKPAWINDKLEHSEDIL